MKLLKRIIQVALATAAVLVGTTALAQNARYDNVVLAPNYGSVKSIAGATVTVCAAGASGIPCTPTTAICASASDTTCTSTNPFVSDVNGNYGFWAKPGTYTVTVTASGLSGYSIQVTLGSPNSAVKPAASDGIYFVSNNGNDTFEGRSWGSAFLTVAAAETACGSVNLCKIFVASTFSGTVPTTPTSANITIIAVGGEEWLNSGTFTNTQMNESLESLLNSCSPLIEFQGIQGGTNFATDALAGCLIVPSGGAVHNANAVAGYAVSNSSSQGTGGAVGGYFQGHAKVNGSKVWGSNCVVFDDIGLTSGVNLICGEDDLQPQNAPSAYNTVIGRQISLFSPQSGTFTGSKAVFINHGQTGIWENGIFIDNGNVASSALTAGAICGTGTCNSSNITFKGLNSSVENKSFLFGTSTGEIDAQPTSGQNFKLLNGNYVGTALQLISSGGGTIMHQAPNTAASVTVTDPVATTVTPVVGTCTMSTTTCTVTVISGASKCIVTDNSASHISGGCAISGTTLTVTAASSNTDTWSVLWW